jgi:hypothetical protein
MVMEQLFEDAAKFLVIEDFGRIGSATTGWKQDEIVVLCWSQGIV